MPGKSQKIPGLSIIKKNHIICNIETLIWNETIFGKSEKNSNRSFKSFTIEYFDKITFGKLISDSMYQLMLR